MTTKIDREQWSLSSKQSYAYREAAGEYGDIRYTCRKCGVDAAFTAEEQKIAFEWKQQYVWRRRLLCPPCNGALFKLKEADRECQAIWASDRARLMTDSRFLENWIRVLESIPEYSPRTRSNMLLRLKALLVGCGGS